MSNIQEIVHNLATMTEGQTMELSYPREGMSDAEQEQFLSEVTDELDRQGLGAFTLQGKESMIVALRREVRSAQ